MIQIDLSCRVIELIRDEIGDETVCFVQFLSSRLEHTGGDASVDAREVYRQVNSDTN